MGNKSSREHEVIMFLSRNQDYMTSGDIAKLLNTSQKTVYRLVKKINEDFKDGSLIISEKGRGYKLDYEKYIKSHKSNMTHIKNTDCTPEERRNRVIEELLLSSPKPINIYQLYSDYYVGDSVIFNDEQVMSRMLKRYNLALERKNRTLTALGDEINIRKAIKDVIEIFNVIDIDDLKDNKELNFNKYDVLFILDQLRNIEKSLEITIPHPYNVNIFSHLYIIISRSRKQPSLLFSDIISEKELYEMKANEKLYSTAKSVVNNIEKYLHHHLPDMEVYFLYQYLVSSRLEGSFGPASTFSEEVVKVTNVYIKEMGERLKVNVTGHSIFLDLANHIKPMLNRLEHKIHVHNSLLDQIKITYEKIFWDVKNVSKYVSEKFGFPEINDDENGFITLYFAKIIETNQFHQPIKTLIMCTTGIGTSELLKAKVTKQFPELEIVDVVPSRNLSMFKNKYPDIELILSTIYIEEQLSIKFLLVSAMFNKEDRERLQEMIEVIYHER